MRAWSSGWARAAESVRLSGRPAERLAGSSSAPYGGDVPGQSIGAVGTGRHSARFSPGHEKIREVRSSAWPGGAPSPPGSPFWPSVVKKRLLLLAACSRLCGLKGGGSCGRASRLRSVLAVAPRAVARLWFAREEVGRISVGSGIQPSGFPGVASAELLLRVQTPYPRKDGWREPAPASAGPLRNGGSSLFLHVGDRSCVRRSVKKNTW